MAGTHDGLHDSHFTAATGAYFYSSGLSSDNAVVEKFNNTGELMATVNFSVPDDLKRKFDRAFSGKNKSRVIADLMARAVEEQQAAKRRTAAIEALLARRRTKQPAMARELRVRREAGRP